MSKSPVQFLHITNQCVRPSCNIKCILLDQLSDIASIPVVIKEVLELPTYAALETIPAGALHLTGELLEKNAP